MPELPEVETIRLDLIDPLLGRSIDRVEQRIDDPHYVNLEAAQTRTIRDLRRRGKYLIADLGDRELVLHLGMTGQLGVVREVPSHLRHLHVLFHLDDGTHLFFNDQRRFGRLIVVTAGDYTAIPTLATMGPEPLGPDFRYEPFAEAVAKATTIKPLLLSQRIVAGLGNIYVDEALHLARIHPERGRLSRKEARRLFEAIPAVLTGGLERRGTTFKDYRDGMGRYGTNQDFLRVFDREGQPCPVCGRPIEKIWVSQRGTHFCPTCQPRES
jgi:formamidopyrimidine-DNA glycosylase